MEEIGASIKGIYRDIIKDRNNRTIHDSGWMNNKIVDGCRILLAASMKNEKTSGIKRLKLGKGDPNWDTNGTPYPTATVTDLEDPSPYVIEIENLDVDYLNESDAKVLVPTNRLQVTVTLGVGEPPPEAPLTSYPLREFGLFGVYTDENDADQEYMIDCIRHPVIHKDASATLIRMVKLYF